MSLRRRQTLLLLLALGLSGGVLAGCGSSAGSSVPPPKAGVGTPMDSAVPQRILDLPFTDSTGHRLRLSDLAGKTVVISDSMTLCQEACPVDTATLLQTARALEAASPSATRDVVFLTITVDPQRDTPAQLAAYRRQYAGTGLPQWRLLTGRPADVHALWKYLGVFWKKTPEDDGVVRNWRTGKKLTYDVAHSDEVFFLDTRQRERFILDGIPSLAGDDDVPKRIRAFMSAEGHHNEHKTDGWTSADAMTVLSWLLQQRLA